MWSGRSITKVLPTYHCSSTMQKSLSVCYQWCSAVKLCYTQSSCTEKFGLMRALNSVWHNVGHELIVQPFTESSQTSMYKSQTCKEIDWALGKRSVVVEHCSLSWKLIAWSLSSTSGSGTNEPKGYLVMVSVDEAGGMIPNSLGLNSTIWAPVVSCMRVWFDVNFQS